MWWGVDRLGALRYTEDIPIYPAWQKRFARRMRHRQTDAEALLWWELRHKSLGVRFRRQHPIGSFIVDFVCLQHRLVVEADGSQHGGPYDQRRDTYLRSLGYTVRHFWSWDVISDLDWVVDTIVRDLDRLGRPPTNRPPAD